MLSNSFPNLFLLLQLCTIDRDSFVEHEHTDKITTVATEMNQILSYAYSSSGSPPLPVPSSVTLLSDVKNNSLSLAIAISAHLKLNMITTMVPECVCTYNFHFLLLWPVPLT